VVWDPYGDKGLCLCPLPLYITPKAPHPYIPPPGGGEYGGPYGDKGRTLFLGGPFLIRGVVWGEDRILLGQLGLCPGFFWSHRGIGPLFLLRGGIKG